MPASLKKDLYLASSMDGLKKLTALPKTMTNNGRLMLNSSKKLLESGNKSLLEGNEEQAYVYLMKYIDLVTRIKKSSEYKKDAAYFKNMLDAKEVNRAMRQLEELHGSLSDRYEYREAEQVSRRLQQLDELEASTEPEAPPVEPQPTTSAKEVTSEQLYTLLTDGSSLLVLDARPAADFRLSHSRGSVSVPEEILRPGSTASTLRPHLPPDSLDQWDRRDTYDVIVLLDWRSSAISDSLQVLKDALYKWESVTLLKSEPVVLVGGYEDLALTYPMLCTAPVAPRPAYAVPAAVPDYPDLDLILNELRDEPSVSPSAARGVIPDRGTKPAHLMADEGRINAAYQLDDSVNREIQSNESISKGNQPDGGTNGSSQSNGSVSGVSQSNGGTYVNGSNGSVNSSSSQSASSNASQLISLSTPSVKSSNSGQSAADNRSSQPINSAPPMPAAPSFSRANKPKPSAPNDQSQAEQEARNQQLQREKDDYLQQMMVRLRELKAKQQQLEEVERLKHEEVKQVSDLMRMKRRLAEDCRQLEERNQRMAEAEPEVKVKPEVKVPLPPGRSGSPNAQRTSPEKPEVAKQLSTNVDLSTSASSDKGVEPSDRAGQPAQKEVSNQEQASALGPPAPKPEQPSKQDTSGALTSSAVSSATSGDVARMVTRQGLPEGWEKKLDRATGRFYFVDHATRSTHWHLPNELVLRDARDVTGPQKNKAAGSHVTRLKGDGGGQSSGMKRSNSTPDLASLGEGGGQTPALPSRKEKPSGDDPLRPVNPSFSRPVPVQLAAAELRALQPAYGSVKRGATGLRNLGNTCFMNSVVQCLSHTAPLSEFFLSGVFERDVNVYNKLGHKGNVVRQFAVLIKALWVGQYKYVAPHHFKETVSHYYDMFLGSQQHDAQEFMSFLMDGLHEDTNRVLKRPQLPAQENDGLTDVQAASRAWAQHKMLNESIIVSLFQGQFKSTVTCQTCKKQSVTFDAFMYLSVPIPKVRGRVSLVDCLNEFLKPERLDGESRWNCPRCKQMRVAEKQISIWKLPPVLLLHLKRFWYEGNFRRKITEPVQYPLTGLDFSSCVLDPKAQRAAYDLYGVVNHFGSMEGGHYIAHCRSAVTDRWVKFDDEAVSSISESSVCSSAGYILFYTNMRFKPPTVE